MQVKADNPFGRYLRDKLEKMEMSIRKLAHECGYDPATISRLVNGKQKPRPEHLVKIAQVLQIPVIELWQAAGFIKHEHTPEDPVAQKPISPRDGNFYSLLPLESLDISRILVELEKYRLYAQTDEGHGLILQEFDKKISQIKGIGPFIEKLQDLYKLYQDYKTEPEQKHIIGSVLLYFILPTDIIPDYLFPTGYLDDAMAIDIVWAQIQALPKPADE